MRKKNPPGKETSKRVGSAAGRLQRRRGGKFWYEAFTGGELQNVTRDVRAVAASAHVQRQGAQDAKRRLRK